MSHAYQEGFQCESCDQWQPVRSLTDDCLCFRCAEREIINFPSDPELAAVLGEALNTANPLQPK